MPDDHPNILIIMSDQHSRRFAGCYGNRIVRTPNLDRLAEEGMRLENAYCAAPLCVPSRMSLMTSRTPGRNRVWNNHHVLNSGIPTWAHVLGTAGYETLLFGRMHFNGPDQHHGFEHRPIGELHSQNPGVPMADCLRREMQERLYAGWEPAGTLTEAEDATASFLAMCRHGRAVPRQHECAPVLPPAEYETFEQR